MNYDEIAIKLYENVQSGYGQARYSIPHNLDWRFAITYDARRGKKINKGQLINYAGIDRFRLTKMLVNDIVTWWVYDHLKNIAKLRFVTNHRITVHKYYGDGTAFLVNTSDEALVEAKLLGLF
jgi:ribosome-associated protein YbcJ (S4-like RNA binding protein)